MQRPGLQDRDRRRWVVRHAARRLLGLADQPPGGGVRTGQVLRDRGHGERFRQQFGLPVSRATVTAVCRAGRAPAESAFSTARKPRMKYAQPRPGVLPLFSQCEKGVEPRMPSVVARVIQ